MKHNRKYFGISTKLIVAFLLTSLITFAVTMYMNQHINGKLAEIEHVYTTNNQLNQISQELDGIQESMKDYLDLRSTKALTEYYDYQQNYKELVEKLNREILDDDAAIMEKNICGLSDNYLSLADQAVYAKRAKSISTYKVYYTEASEIYNYLYAHIFSLNNIRFEANSDNYGALANGLRLLEKMTVLINTITALFSILILVFIVHQITKPLSELSEAANQVGQGNFEIKELPVRNLDEVGVVTGAFNQMIVSIRNYMVRLKDSIQKENEAKERELLMETSLKDAQLKYYQAQIHPHFLFNTLNAAAQMAMLEDAERTGSFIQHTSEFFRYSLHNPERAVTLGEEINLVENYIYIMNERFSGEIHYHKEIYCDINKVKVPSMILQPVVENAIRYGIREIEWQGNIDLVVREGVEHYQIMVQDNGMGIDEKRLQELQSGTIHAKENEDDSNGIGLNNVIERLNLYYQREGLFNISSEGIGKGTKVTIYIPKPEE